MKWAARGRDRAEVAHRGKAMPARGCGSDLGSYRRPLAGEAAHRGLPAKARSRPTPTHLARPVKRPIWG